MPLLLSPNQLELNYVPLLPSTSLPPQSTLFSPLFSFNQVPQCTLLEPQIWPPKMKNPTSLKWVSLTQPNAPSSHSNERVVWGGGLGEGMLLKSKTPLPMRSIGLEPLTLPKKLYWLMIEMPLPWKAPKLEPTSSILWYHLIWHSPDTLWHPKPHTPTAINLPH